MNKLTIETDIPSTLSLLEWFKMKKHMSNLSPQHANLRLFLRMDVPYQALFSKYNKKDISPCSLKDVIDQVYLI